MKNGDADRWVVDVDEVKTVLDTPDDVRRHVDTLAEQPSGRIFVFVDHGPTRRWERFLGLKRDISPCLTIEWHGPYASLIFHDDAASEYRAIDPTRPVSATEEERSRIAHGEPVPHPADECMEKARAFEAIAEFIVNHRRPTWLMYRYVR